MPSDERIRIEIAFDGGAIVGATVSSKAIEELERALASESGATIALDADDGSYIVALRHVLYVKRFARGSRVGFGKS